MKNPNLRDIDASASIHEQSFHNAVPNLPGVTVIDRRTREAFVLPRAVARSAVVALATSTRRGRLPAPSRIGGGR